MKYYFIIFRCFAEHLPTLCVFLDFSELHITTKYSFNVSQAHLSQKLSKKQSPHFRNLPRKFNICAALCQKYVQCFLRAFGAHDDQHLPIVVLATLLSNKISIAFKWHLEGSDLFFLVMYFLIKHRVPYQDFLNKSLVYARAR